MRIINRSNTGSRWKSIIHNKPTTSELNHSRTTSGSVRGNRLVNKRLFLLLAVILLPLLAGCAPGGVGDDANGWNPPVSDDGVVYVGTKDGEVIALIDNGFEGVSNREIWSFPASIDQGDIEGAYATPLVQGDLVYIAGIDGYVYALNKENGSISDGGWKRPRGFVEELEPLVSGLTYDPANDIILSANGEGQLNAYTADLGENFWENPFQADKEIWSTPVVDSQFAYFGSHDHKAYAVRLSNGEKFWEYQTGGVVAGKPLLFDGKVIFGSFDRTLYAVSADASGNVSLDWSFKGDNWFWAGAITDGQTIFAPNMDGNIYALDTNGNLLWKHHVGGSIVSQPVLVDRGLVVVNKGGDLFLLSTDASQQGIARELSNPIKLDAQVKAPLYAGGDVVFVGSQDRRVRRVDLKVGETAWCWHTRDGSCNN